MLNLLPLLLVYSFTHWCLGSLDECWCYSCCGGLRLNVPRLELQEVAGCTPTILRLSYVRLLPTWSAFPFASHSAIDDLQRTLAEDREADPRAVPEDDRMACYRSTSEDTGLLSNNVHSLGPRDAEAVECPWAWHPSPATSPRCPIVRHAPAI